MQTKNECDMSEGGVQVLGGATGRTFGPLKKGSTCGFIDLATQPDSQEHAPPSCSERRRSAADQLSMKVRPGLAHKIADMRTSRTCLRSLVLSRNVHFPCAAKSFVKI